MHGRPRNAPWSPNRDNAAHKRFRRALMRRAGGRCERCRRAGVQLRACHFPSLAAGGDYDPAHGLALCADCDRATDPHAR